MIADGVFLHLAPKVANSQKNPRPSAMRIETFSAPGPESAVFAEKLPQSGSMASVIQQPAP